MLPVGVSWEIWAEVGGQHRGPGWTQGRGGEAGPGQLVGPQALKERGLSARHRKPPLTELLAKLGDLQVVRGGGANKWDISGKIN